MMVMASPTRAVPWTAPEDYLVDEGNDVKDLALSERDTYLVMWADGRAVEIRSGAVGGEYRKMMTYSGREPFSPRDIEFAEVHECFTIAEILATEDLGFVEKGQGGPYAASCATALDGERARGGGGFRTLADFRRGCLAESRARRSVDA